MKKLTALLLAIITILSLAGCNVVNDVPSGMQLVRGGEDVGYYLYSPDGWIIANQGDIAATYMSTIDTTSITLAEASMPSGSIAEYFEAEAEKFEFPINVTKANADYKLGNAEEAKQFIYDYEYSGYKFRTMQIFAKYDGRFYIFTFSSQLGERRDGESYYDYHLNNNLKSITDNLKFVKKTGTESKPEYPSVDGYLLVSDKGLCGFDLYVTESYSVDYSDGIVSVSSDDGASITVSKATSTDVSIKDYWKNRKSELEAIVGTVTEIDVNKTDGVTLGSLTTAASYEYTYVVGGVTYHVYQVFGVDLFSGYAFTFTAPEDVYTARIGEALDIAARIRF